jgi:hypothetical protein
MSSTRRSNPEQILDLLQEQDFRFNRQGIKVNVDKPRGDVGILSEKISNVSTEIILGKP